MDRVTVAEAFSLDRAAALARTFSAARPSPAVGCGLGAALVAFVDAARAAWPRIRIDDEAFVRHLALRVGAGPVPDALSTLHGGDLYLACACATGVPAAIGEFERAFTAKIDGYVGRVAHTRESRDEVRQNVRHALLVGEGGRPPSIAGYSGRGPLGAWVRVTAVRAALCLLRRTGPELVDAGEAMDVRSTGDDPELAFLKRRYASVLNDAFVSTLANLATDERNVLRLHYLDGLTLEDVAATYKVSRATAARWLADARAKILKETRRRLKDTLGAREQEIDSLLALVVSRLPLSVRRHFE